MNKSFLKNIFFGKSIENASFRQTDQGIEFYPYGMFGAAYLVSSEQKAALFSVTQKFCILAAIPIGVGIFKNWLIATPILAGVLIYYPLALRKHLTGAIKIKNRLRFSDRLRMMAVATSPGRMIVLLASGVIMTALGIAVIFRGHQLGDDKILLTGTACAALFAIGLVLIAAMAWTKWRGEPLTPAGSDPPPP